MKIKSFLKVLFVLGLFLSAAPLNEAFATAKDIGVAVTKTSGGDGGAMQTVLCNVLRFVTGTVGKTIASFIIIGVGVGFFTGKVSWAVLIGVTLGISAMFGAPAIIQAVTGDDGNWCDDGNIITAK